jgi:uncharacterized protein Yka (UPF0111/DUF47 family)
MKAPAMRLAASNQYAIQLEKMGVLVLEAAELLSRFLRHDSAERVFLASRIKEFEQRGDDLARGVIDKLNRAPIKPLDVKLVWDLSQALHNILDLLAVASSRFVLFQIQEPVPFTPDSAEMLLQQSREILACLKAMHSDGHVIEHCAGILRLGNELRRLHETSTVHLFETVTDPIELVKQKEIVDILAQAAEKTRALAHLVESSLPANGNTPWSCPY